MSPEQLRQFAEACGWTSFQSYGNGGGFWHRDGCIKRARNSSCECGGHWTLPDFLRSKDAVIEGLEYFCPRYVIWADKDDYIVSIYYLKVGRIDGTPAKTINEAIIQAVLSASEGRKG